MVHIRGSYKGKGAGCTFHSASDLLFPFCGTSTLTMEEKRAFVEGDTSFTQ